MFKPSRKFKANVTAGRFFLLRRLVVVILILGAGNFRAFHRPAPPVEHQP